MYRFNMPANGRTVLRRLIDAVAQTKKTKKNKKKRSCAQNKKKYITTPYTISILYFNTLLRLYFIPYAYTLRKNNTLKISQIPNANFQAISKKANCKYVAAKRKFQNNFQNSRTFKITTRCNLKGELSESGVRARANAHSRSYMSMHADPSQLVQRHSQGKLARATART